MFHSLLRKSKLNCFIIIYYVYDSVAISRKRFSYTGVREEIECVLPPQVQQH